MFLSFILVSLGCALGVCAVKELIFRNRCRKLRREIVDIWESRYGTMENFKFNYITDRTPVKKEEKLAKSA